MDSPEALAEYISIHASRMGGDASPASPGNMSCISIHASRMGGDTARRRSTSASPYFNPRLPDGRRLDKAYDVNLESLFQSTPPGWEATRWKNFTIRLIGDFNPRLPDGRRRRLRERRHRFRHFNPRLPDGRRRTRARAPWKATHFNPRLPDGRRRTRARAPWKATHFNPRLPDGRRQAANEISLTEVLFQSTPPGWEATTRAAP